MKNSYTFYFKILSLNLFFILIFGNALSAQEPIFAPPQDSFGLLAMDTDSEGTFVDLVDIDHDDTLEAFVSSTNGVHYFENNGSNTKPNFVFEESDPFGIIFADRRPWQFVDLTGDGLEDLFLFGFLENEPVRMVKNTGDSTMPNYFNPIMNNPYGIQLPVSDLDGSLLDAVAPTFADIDNDGDYDLFLGGAFINNPGLADEKLYFSRNNGSGTAPQFDSIEKNPFGFVFPPSATIHWEIFEDLDCDGDLDMYFTGPTSNRYYYENIGNPEQPDFSAPGLPSQSAIYPFIPPAGSFLDIGSDGDMDLITGTDSPDIWFFENLTSTNFSYSFSGDELTYTFTTDFSNNATSWLWDFGDGNTSDEENPVYTFPDYGEYEVCLTAEGGLNCQNTSCQLIDIVLSVKDLQLDATLKLYPNPAFDFLTFELVSEENLDQVKIAIFNMVGQKITSLSMQATNNTFQERISLKGLPSGFYLLKASAKDKFLAHKFVKL